MFQVLEVYTSMLNMMWSSCLLLQTPTLFVEALWHQKIESRHTYAQMASMQSALGMNLHRLEVRLFYLTLQYSKHYLQFLYDSHSLPSYWLFHWLVIFCLRLVRKKLVGRAGLPLYTDFMCLRDLRALLFASSASTVHQRKLNWRERIPNVHTISPSKGTMQLSRESIHSKHDQKWWNMCVLVRIERVRKFTMVYMRVKSRFLFRHFVMIYVVCFLCFC